MSQYEIRLVGSVLAKFEDYPTEKQIAEYLRRYTVQELLDATKVWVEDVVDA